VCCRLCSTWQLEYWGSWRPGVQPIYLQSSQQPFSVSRLCVHHHSAGTRDVLLAGSDTFRALWRHSLNTLSLVSVYCTLYRPGFIWLMQYFPMEILKKNGCKLFEAKFLLTFLQHTAMVIWLCFQFLAAFCW